MLEVSGLTRRYGDFVAVSGVSFAIGTGEITGLLGHNGAGKTTIMKMVSGYLEPHAGSIRLEGTELADDTKRLQRELGYLPENLPVYQDLVVADYLDFAAEMKGLAAADKARELRRVVEATEIGDKLLAPISTLSRGYKQRVGVAQAILARPRLLILDEPTNGLDPTQTEHMRSLIRDLSAEATVILSTHIMQEVEALCDRALILRAGELVVDARLEELRQADAVLVSASAGADLGAALASLDGITAVEPVAAAEDEQRLRLRLDASTEPRRACAAVAAAVQAAGAALYSLGVERRDLETLFREVNRAGAAEVRHAA